MFSLCCIIKFLSAALLYDAVSFESTAKVLFFGIKKKFNYYLCRPVGNALGHKSANKGKCCDMQ